MMTGAQSDGVKYLNRHTLLDVFPKRQKAVSRIPLDPFGLSCVSISPNSLYMLKKKRSGRHTLADVTLKKL